MADPVKGSVTFADESADDGWGVEFIKLFLNNGVVILCLEFGIGIIDTDSSGEPTSLNFECQPGMFSLLFIVFLLKVFWEPPERRKNRLLNIEGK